MRDACRGHKETPVKLTGTTSFLVLALPRSRTAWLSQFLSYDGWHCGHDQLRYMRSLEDAKAWLSQPMTGSCETAAAPFWRIIAKLAPGIPVLTVRRPVPDVVGSLLRAGLDADPAVLTRRMLYIDRKIDQLEGRLPNVVKVSFDDLATAEGCAKAFGHCLGRPLDTDWWDALSGQNIQVDLAPIARYARAHRGALQALAARAKESMLREIAMRRFEGGQVCVEEGTIETLAAEGAEMMQRHCVDVGESPDGWISKNIGLMDSLNRNGHFQVMIGRCNGKIFGYLGSLVGPSLEAPGRLVAEHRMFYAAREVPGLGMKLLRAAASRLKEKGVTEIFMRAGVRGEGPRLGVLYRRLGAHEFGQAYRLKLEE